jgi:hypothetical protein
MPKDWVTIGSGIGEGKSRNNSSLVIFGFSTPISAPGLTNFRGEDVSEILGVKSHKKVNKPYAERLSGLNTSALKAVGERIRAIIDIGLKTAATNA